MQTLKCQILKRGMKHFTDNLAKIKTIAMLSELQRATMDATRITQNLKETIDDFEKQNIRDIKKIFGQFARVSCTLWPTRVFRAWMRRRTWSVDLLNGPESECHFQNVVYPASMDGLINMNHRSYAHCPHPQTDVPTTHHKLCRLLSTVVQKDI